LTQSQIERSKASERKNQEEINHLNSVVIPKLKAEYQLNIDSYTQKLAGIQLALTQAESSLLKADKLLSEKNAQISKLEHNLGVYVELASNLESSLRLSMADDCLAAV
jgi:hypothetical protein